MSRTTKGDIDGAVIIQPDRSISEKNDGTLEGQVIYKCDSSNISRLPRIGTTHPDDNRLECYNISRTYNSNGLVTATASFFGLISSTTDPVITYSGGQNNEAITTHPNFTDFAGTVDAPLNGAVFETDTTAADYGSFIEFGGGEDADGPQFRGIEYYLTPSTMITLSYWTDKVPSLKNRLKIYSRIRGVSSAELKVPSDVEDFLLLDTPYRQVGSFYQVTEQYLGSGPRGWNEIIYNA